MLKGLLGILVSVIGVAAAMCFAQGAGAPPPNAQAHIVTGRVCGARGEALSGAWVSLEKNGLSELETASQSDGGFHFDPSGPGPYVVKVVNNNNGKKESASTQPFTVSAGEQRNVELRFGAPGSSCGETAAPGVGELEFSDQPKFTVSGITNPSAGGGHGSDIGLRTSEALARDTASLKAGKSTQPSEESAANLRAVRDRLLAKLQQENRAEDHRLLGDVYEKLGDPVSAVREYQAAAETDPSEGNYFSWGAELLLHHAIQPSLEVFSKGSAAHPDSARMLEGLGAALYASGSNERAVTSLCRAADLQPRDPAAYLFLGKMEKSVLDMPACAEQKLARFTELDPNNAAANYYYAIALLKSHAPDVKSARAGRAESLLKKAVSADPKFADAYLQLGIMYSFMSQAAAAIAAFRTAISLDPQLSEAHYRLGRLLRANGDDQGAQKEFAAYTKTEKQNQAQLQREREELQQFVIVLKDQPR
jgi:tetratricopeptide (TPR) repeat protein